MRNSTLRMAFSLMSSMLVFYNCSKNNLKDTNPEPGTSRSDLTKVNEHAGTIPTFQKVPGLAVEINAGESEGTTFLLGIGPEVNGYQVFEFDNPSRSFNTPVEWKYIYSPGGVSIASADNRPIIVDNKALASC